MIEILLFVLMCVFGAFCVYYFNCEESKAKSEQEIVLNKADHELIDDFLKALDSKGLLSKRLEDEKKAIHRMRESRERRKLLKANYSKIKNVISIERKIK